MRRRSNPKPTTMLIGVGALAAVGGVAYWLWKRSQHTTVAIAPQSFAPSLQQMVPVSGPRTTALVGASSAAIDALAKQFQGK